jgi:hypothetical protein
MVHLILVELVLQEQLDRRVVMAQLVPQERPGPQVPQGHKVFKVMWVLQEHQVLLEQLVPLDQKVLQVPQARRAQLEQVVQPAQRVQQAPQVLLVWMVTDITQPVPQA